MKTPNQRWLFGHDSYRPPGECIRTAEYEVAAIDSDREAKAFVLTHHYSGTYPAARFRLGLYRGGELCGLAVFSQPVNDASLAVLPGAPAESVELGRFVLLPSVKHNGETFFLGRCFEQLRRAGLVGVISFSDPMRRRSISGDLVHAGHVGTIYQAHNAVYLGRGSPNTLRLLPDGRVLSNRALSKIRGREQGWRYAAEQLVSAGAAPLEGCPRAWLQHWLPRLTRSVRHAGNHKYAWTLRKHHRRHLPASLPYPKLHLEAA